MALCCSLKQRGVCLPYLISRGPNGTFSRLKGSDWHNNSSLHNNAGSCSLGLSRLVQTQTIQT